MLDINGQEFNEEQPSGELVRRVNEPFMLFDPAGKIYKKDSLGRTDFKQGIKLELEESEDPIAVLFHAKPDIMYNSKGFAITPFQPEVGYQITQDDFISAAQRVSKTEAWRDVKIDKYAPLNLSINDNALDRPNEARKVPYPQKIRDTFSRLRLILSFPNSDFQSKIRFPNSLMEFEYFYPLDSGPFFQDTGKRLWEGLHLNVPADLNLLQQIQGTFALMPDLGQPGQKI